MGQFKSLKQIFSKFVGHFDLEGQGQGHKFLELSKTLDDQYTPQVEGQFPTVQKLFHSQGITRNFIVSRPI